MSIAIIGTLQHSVITAEQCAWHALATHGYSSYQRAGEFGLAFPRERRFFYQGTPIETAPTGIVTVGPGIHVAIN